MASPIRMTGLTSGLDTESIVKALTSNYQNKVDKNKKAQTKLSWKQDAWKEINKKVYSLYSSLDSLRYSSGYKLQKATCSDTTKATVTSSGSAFTGTQKLKINNTATSASLTGAQLEKGTTGSTTLAELGMSSSSGKITLSIGKGEEQQTKEISVSASTTIDQFVDQLKEAGLSASFDSKNGRLFLSAKDSGSKGDFTLTGANGAGADALYALGISVQSNASDALYASYKKYAGASEAETRANVESAISSYRDAKAAISDNEASISNIRAAYAYANAITSRDAAYENSGLTDAQKTRYEKALLASSDTVLTGDNKAYNKLSTDDDGNITYSYTGEDGVEKRILAKVSGEDAEGNKTYTYYDQEQQGSFATYSVGGKTYTATTTADAQIFKDEDGAEYRLSMEDGKKVLTQTKDKDGNAVSGDAAAKVDVTDVTAGSKANFVTAASANTSVETAENIKKGTEEIYLQNAGISEENKEKAASDLRSAVSSAAGTIQSFENAEETVSDDAADTYTRDELKSMITAAYNNGNIAEATDLFSGYLQTNRENVTANQKTLDENGVLASAAALDPTSQEYTDAVNALVSKATNAADMSANQRTNTGVVRTAGEDAQIELGGVTYTSASGIFSVNGLNITALAKTEGDGITINTQTDTQGLYDKIKDFISNYNDVINELTDTYNAASAKGYEPLTDDEKSAMSDKQVEKWEKKIKDSLLRRDTTLNSIMQTLTTSMSSIYEVNGKKYSLATFGIKTKGILNSEANRQNAYHIDGDADDSDVASNADKLMAAINEDPEGVTDFMKQLVDGLYKNLDKKMKSTSLKSAYTIYNDKEMKTEYSSYTSQIKKWQDRLSAMEEKYYKQFAKMESTLTKLQSSTSGLTGLMGR
ncbi:MAG: flagellar filament capping protein FliD [Lachnospiraceae bacterium]|nr:flagellar filament capping protein FliD [Lachnospiraceae bacterium]